LVAFIRGKSEKDCTANRRRIQLPVETADVIPIRV